MWTKEAYPALVLVTALTMAGTNAVYANHSTDPGSPTRTPASSAGDRQACSRDDGDWLLRSDGGCHQPLEPAAGREQLKQQGLFELNTRT